MNEIPPTRWEQWGQSGYKDEFTRLIESGADVEGEARLADTLVARGSRILDAGAGIGRIGGALQARGHEVLAVEKDPELVERAARLFPGLPMLTSDLLALTPASLAATGHDGGFDLIVLVGNVIVFAAEDTEPQLLASLRDLLADGGRILVGFHPVRMHGNARDYPFDAFAADVGAAGLAVQHRFGTYELHPPADDYVVAVLTRA
ncbi:class I SAM-dependent methyltransferase [Nocardioides marmorisolisilvae]|uniref:Methyltransferase domain-containing protein n=1 Tax=Nocardioides marmorisolisilvae TaxID=1542737 RepID=A0A3N0DZF0_9ACTN|nr:methyltransferase [Nocardioides marmorisolisilvae]RNL80972.1 methyltransferase domain-containing protein [Nocardioides marmorisolisilvae]